MIVNGSDSSKYWSLIKHIGSFNEKWNNIAETKANIIGDLIESLDQNIKTILFVSFNPIALELASKYDVTIMCNSELTQIFDCSKVNIISDFTGTYDCVLALDEFLTYVKTEADQKELLGRIRNVTGKYLIATLNDYKNLAPHKRNQIDTTSVIGPHNYIMLESSIADKTDKQHWEHYWCCIKDHVDFTSIGPIDRRTLYFKQFAKYVSDIGSTEYVVQKNLLYKGFFSKGYEHIITVKF